MIINIFLDINKILKIKMNNTKEGLTLVKNKLEEYYVDSQGRKQGEVKLFTTLGKIWIISNYVNGLKCGECIHYFYNSKTNG